DVERTPTRKPVLSGIGCPLRSTAGSPRSSLRKTNATAFFTSEGIDAANEDETNAHRTPTRATTPPRFAPRLIALGHPPGFSIASALRRSREIPDRSGASQDGWGILRRRDRQPIQSQAPLASSASFSPSPRSPAPSSSPHARHPDTPA